MHLCLWSFVVKYPDFFYFCLWILFSLSSSLLLSDNMEKTTYIRFLVSNAAAGSVIGKGGSTINDFQSQTGARIQLSRNHEFFPGTTDRIIMVSGIINEILKAMELVLTKLLSEVMSMQFKFTLEFKCSIICAWFKILFGGSFMLKKETKLNREQKWD